MLPVCASMSVSFRVTVLLGTLFFLMSMVCLFLFCCFALVFVEVFPRGFLQPVEFAAVSALRKFGNERVICVQHIEVTVRL